MRFFIVLFLFFFVSEQVCSQMESLNARKLFTQSRPLLFKVQISESKSAPKMSYGTGFALERTGLIATNFHVISSFVHQEGDNLKIFVETKTSEGMKRLPADLKAFSIQDDLALLQVNGVTFEGAFSWAAQGKRKGARIYSMGLPEDLQMGIVEGVYNGMENNGPYKVFFLSTPINSGMSGGPTVDAQGNLIGINVSKLLFSEDISFAVPVERLIQLKARYDRSAKEAFSPKKAKEEAYKQLGALSNQMVKSIVDADLKSLDIAQWGQLQVPKELKCWSDAEPKKEWNYHDAHYTCHLNAAAFFERNISAGTFSINVRTLKTRGISTWGAMSVLAQKSYRPSLIERLIDPSINRTELKERYSSFHCDRGFFERGKEDNFKRWSYCLRAYKKNKAVVDFVYQLKIRRKNNYAVIHINHNGVAAKDLGTLSVFWNKRLEQM